MAGHDERRDRDLDDWFDEPEPPTARRRPDEPRAPSDDAQPAAPAREDDWLGGGTMRPARRPRVGFPSGLPTRRVAVAVVAALVVLLVLGLALSGAFSGSKPRRAATTAVTTHAATTHAATTHAATTTQAKQSQVAAPSGTLKPGDTGPEVKVLQRALASLGYPPGAIDGNYGTGTQRAVAQFQTASKLTADGVLGPQTLSALRTALETALAGP